MIFEIFNEYCRKGGNNKNKAAETKLAALLYGKVNPSVLIGSFLVGISPYGPFPWKRS